MGEDAKQIRKPLDAESKAAIDIWKYVFGFTDAALVKCAINLGIPDAIASHAGDSITLSQLSSALSNADSTPSLRRVMRFLVNRGFFTLSMSQDPSDPTYSLTPLSKLLLKDGPRTLTPLILLEVHSTMLATWQNMAAHVLGQNTPFVNANGEDVWELAALDREFGRVIDEAMSCHARITVPVLIERWPELFHDVRMVLDVGGGNGSAMAEVTRVIPSIEAINFDLPHVVADAPIRERVIHIGGDMFKKVPKADAAFIMVSKMFPVSNASGRSMIGQTNCIQILRNCIEAIPREKGKVIIVEAVIEEEDEEEGAGGGDGLRGVRLALDMAMMAHTKDGKERTRQEWEFLLKEAGFSSHNIKPIPAMIQSVIEAFP